MSWKTNAVIGATVLAGVVGINHLLEVKTPEEYKEYQQEQGVEHGGHAVEMENDRQREKLPGGIDGENSRKLAPSEVRPAEPHVKLRIRP